MYFRYFIIISLWKRTGLFIWTNLTPLYPKMHCAKFGWNWLSGSREEDFYFVNVFYENVVIISPWKRAGPSFEQIWIRFTQWCFSTSASGEEDANLKSLQTDRRTDRWKDRQTDRWQLQVIRKDHLSFQLKWAKKQCV